ncbi:MAG: hypothetical protein L0J64_08565, partial [Corynebacterium sp.]|uniref:hypothetical protein n=1 Tax=Corynebacterium sp. TaxID=1720 RepID=UPI0026479AD2
MSGKQSESPRRPHIADDLVDQLDESVREQVELSGGFLDDETIESITHAIAANAELQEQANKKVKETVGPTKALRDQRSSFT